MASKRAKAPVHVTYRALRVLELARRYGTIGLSAPTADSLERFQRAEKQLTRAAIMLVVDDRKRIITPPKKRAGGRRK